jgi:hypothetical protein
MTMQSNFCLHGPTCINLTVAALKAKPLEGILRLGLQITVTKRPINALIETALILVITL